MKQIMKVLLFTMMLNSVAFTISAGEKIKSTNLATKLEAYNKKKPLNTIFQKNNIIAVENKTSKDAGGVFQDIELNQKKVKTIFFSADSKAENVSDLPSNDYSVYLDITYVDGSKSYALTTIFRTGTHDWQNASRLYTPSLPIKKISFYLLFRKHTGKVWFKNIILAEEK